VRAHFLSAVSNGSSCVIPLMVYYEVRRGLLANDAHNRMRSFEKLCVNLKIDELTIADMDTAADLYAKHRRGKTIYDSDLLIAAQCLTRGYTLVTNNTKHFTNIDGINLVDWTQ
jgi:predicted nucleic acid-binding protein